MFSCVALEMVEFISNSEYRYQSVLRTKNSGSVARETERIELVFFTELARNWCPRD